MLKEEGVRKIIEKSIEETVRKELEEMFEEGRVPILQTLLEKLLNKFMLSERGIILKGREDVGNGFYERSLLTGLGKLNLRVPRTRATNYRSLILPEYYSRGEESYTGLLTSLVTNGYSPSNLKLVLASLNLPYSPKEIEQITNDLREEYYDFVRREIAEDVFVIYIDGYKMKLKDSSSGRVENMTLYSVIGIDMEWRKDVYGFYLLKGNENKGDWIKVFDDLISRGMKRVSLVVSDDFSGIKDAISELFPYSDHQLCITHFKRNITRHMSKEDGNEFKKEFETIKSCKSYEKAVMKFESVLLRYKDSYKSFIGYMWQRRERYLSFMKYPERIRKYVYTTNVAENFNRRIEQIRLRLSGYFQSEEVLGINVILQIKRLKNGKWKYPNPIFKSCEYELFQLHRLKFGDKKLDTNIKEALNEMNNYSVNSNKEVLSA